MNRIWYKFVPLLLCCFVVLAGCTTTTSNIPLLLRYADGTQQSLVKMTWNIETGDIVTDTGTVATFTDTSTDAEYAVWWPTKPNYWVPLIGDAISNTAVYWNGADKLTLFTIDEIPAQKNVNIVKFSDPQLFTRLTEGCTQHMNRTNCIATSTVLYLYDNGANSPTVYEITASETKSTKIPGYIIGIGKSNGKTYVLTFTREDGATQQLFLHAIGSDGSIDSKAVANSELKLYEQNNTVIDRYESVRSTLVNGGFYMWDSKVDVTSSTPQVISIPSLKDGFDIIAHAGHYGSNYSHIATPEFMQYKNYLLAIGSTFSYGEITVAAFENDKLVGFIIINPLDEQNTTLTTYDATGNQLKSYAIRTPVQVIAPQS